MAVQMLMNNRRRDLARIQDQLREEAANLLSYESLGTRMTQLDEIIKRKASKMLFSMETTQIKDIRLSSQRGRKQVVVQEMLKRVRARRQMVDSYSYLVWFFALFGVFLSILYMQSDNVNRYLVDISILNRVASTLLGNKGRFLAGNDQFYTWLQAVLTSIFTPTVCGNGVCEYPQEYAGFGRFGCIPDCGRFSERTPIRIDLRPAWKANPGGVDLTAFPLAMGTQRSLYRWNIWSETMQQFLLSADTNEESIVVEAPDGKMRLELYQELIVGPDVSDLGFAHFAEMAPRTIPGRRLDSLGWTYGDPSEVFAAAADINRQLYEYCSLLDSLNNSPCKNYDPSPMATALRGMYGLSGTVTVSQGIRGRVNLLSVPFCSISNDPDLLQAAQVDPSFCSGSYDGSSAAADNPGDGYDVGSCLNATVLLSAFSCKAEYDFELWSFGPPRDVSVRPSQMTSIQRMLTPFNNLIGSIIVSQYRRSDQLCSIGLNPSVDAAVRVFPCKGGDGNSAPFGSDPAFLPSSPLYLGKLSVKDFYNASELSSTQDGFSSTASKPYAFFPHEWDSGQGKDPQWTHLGSVGVFKLYFDGRLSSDQAMQRLQYMRDGLFIDTYTRLVTVEMVTYNADFTIFGICTFVFEWDAGGNINWDYQYNTAETAAYGGKKGTPLLFLQILFALMVVADAGRELREMYTSGRDEWLVEYLESFWNWMDWSHLCLLSVCCGFWAYYGDLVSRMTMNDSYPVLSALDSNARMFATSAQPEYNMLFLVDQIRAIADIKMKYMAVNSICVILFVVRILKIIDFQPRMALITRTLRVASTDLLHFLVLFFIVLGGYATMGCLLFGGYLTKFQTLGSSMVELVFILMGWDENVFQEMSTVSETQQPATAFAFYVFYWSWIVISTFVLLNVVLAIVVDAYATVKQNSHESATIASEILEVSKELSRAMGNKLFGSENYISDHMLETVLSKQNDKLDVKNSLFNAVKIANNKSQESTTPVVRIPGGITVDYHEMASLIKENRPKQSQPLFGKNGTFGKAMRTGRAAKLMRATSIKNLLPKKGNLNVSRDCIGKDDHDDDALPEVDRAIEDLMTRYGEVVDESKDDKEVLKLLKAENLKRQMAMYTSQDVIKQQVSALSEVVTAIAHGTLSAEELAHLEQDKLVRLAEDGNVDIDVGKALEVNKTIAGKLLVTVVGARDIPKYDTFSESDPYIVLVIENSGVPGDSMQEPFGRTSTLKNDANPLWNSDFMVETVATKETNLVVIVLDDDSRKEDDLVGRVIINVSALPLAQEVDKWYTLDETGAPQRKVFPRGKPKRPRVHLRTKFTPHTHTAFDDGSAHPDLSGSAGATLLGAASSAQISRWASFNSTPVQSSDRSGHGGQVRTLAGSKLSNVSGQELQQLREKVASIGAGSGEARRLSASVDSNSLCPSVVSLKSPALVHGILHDGSHEPGDAPHRYAVAVRVVRATNLGSCVNAKLGLSFANQSFETRDSRVDLWTSGGTPSSAAEFDEEFIFHCEGASMSHEALEVTVHGLAGTWRVCGRGEIAAERMQTILRGSAGRVHDESVACLESTFDGGKGALATLWISVRGQQREPQVQIQSVHHVSFRTSSGQPMKKDPGEALKQLGMKVSHSMNGVGEHAVEQNQPVREEASNEEAQEHPDVEASLFADVGFDRANDSGDVRSDRSSFLPLGKTPTKLTQNSPQNSPLWKYAQMSSFLDRALSATPASAQAASSDAGGHTVSEVPDVDPKTVEAARQALAKRMAMAQDANHTILADDREFSESEPAIM
eukprot:CAMPEP_0206243566 /NCGR_PEP_ID=MMETSP0047_2-20121206/17674_1 /ASSEMBLY_ACC=CAM_ASM_000192 /TAXON_ID=195065 /ORGANISM="Chroomonas mesostigmatica_cf, Strain CCMP1168" /LENGTH=1778 /DNA_ID=CAMNT_0053668691 /DNA_START=6 /DNA_END=5343 /DNA_ORIENTATION=+